MPYGNRSNAVLLVVVGLFAAVHHASASTVGLPLRIVAEVEADQPAAALSFLTALQADAPVVFGEGGWAYLRGRLAERTGQLPQARDAYLSYLKTPGRPLTDRATVALARLEASGQPQRALSLVQSFARRFPGSAVTDQARLLEISLHEQLGRRRATQTLLATLPRNLRRQAEGRMFSVARQHGSPRRARELALQLLRASEVDNIAVDAAQYIVGNSVLGLTAADRVDLGRAFYLHRDFWRAIDSFREAANTAKTTSERHEATFLLGRAAMKAGDDELARSAFEVVVGSSGALGERALYQLGRIALDCGDEGQGLARFEDLAATGNRKLHLAAESLNKIIRVHAGAGRLGEAERALAELEHIEGATSEWAARGAVEVAGCAVAQGDAQRAVAALAGRRANDRRLRRELDYWRGVAAIELGDTASAVAGLTSAARGNDLIAGLARERLGSVANHDHTQVGQLVAEAGLALANGEAARARELVLKALDGGASGDHEAAARDLRCRTYRSLPRYRDAYQLDGPVAEGTSVPNKAVESLVEMGLYSEAAEELRSAPAGVKGIRRLFEVARLAARGGDFATSLRYADLARRQLPADFADSCLPDTLFDLLYPRAYGAALEAEARAAGVDPHLIRSVMREESRFNPQALSPAGARGLMQFIPETAVRIGQEYGIDVDGPESIHEPSIAIPLGARYLAELLHLFGGHEAPAVAAYNAGEVAAFRWLQRSSRNELDGFLNSIEYDETRTYVDRVLTTLAAYRSR